MGTVDLIQPLGRLSTLLVLVSVHSFLLYHFEQVRTSRKDEVEQLCDKFLSDNDEVPEYFFDR